MKLRKADVKSILEITFPEYKGRKYELEIVSETYLRNRDWAGGTHSDYRLLAEVNNEIQIKSAPDFRPSKALSYEQEKVLIPKNGMIVSHNYFCGHDCGIRIYISPDSIFLPKLLPTK